MYTPSDHAVDDGPTGATSAGGHAGATSAGGHAGATRAGGDAGASSPGVHASTAPASGPGPVTPALASATPPAVATRASGGRTPSWVAWLALAAAALACLLAWRTARDNDALERELVKRQAESQLQVTEARALAKAAEDAARSAQAKAALLEARTADATAQQSQLEALMASLSKTRDEHAVTEIESLLRTAAQQAAWTGRVEPLMVAMKQAEERLHTLDAPRLAPVRRALTRDLERIAAGAAVDGATLAQRLDEVLRRVDDLPLTMQTPAAGDTRVRAPSATHPQPSEVATPTWRDRVAAFWTRWKDDVASEARALVRVSQIDQPGAMLLAPQQAYFVRENLKLRLLSARLAVLSRQHDVAQSDLREAQRMLDAYFDRQSQRVVSANDSLKQVAAASRSTSTLRPDDTLAALALVGGR